jgi:hypothetical protein
MYNKLLLIPGNLKLRKVYNSDKVLIGQLIGLKPYIILI